MSQIGNTGLVMIEYRCTDHDVFELLVDRPPPDEAPCPTCGAPSLWTPSPVRGTVRIGEVHRGKSDERPPGTLDTRPLADGQPASEWRSDQDKAQHDRTWKRAKDVLS